MSESAAGADDKSKTEASAADDKSKGALYHCDYCRADITQLVRIKCAVCDDFDLCVHCFARGNHVAPHQPDHAYRVVDYVRTPLWAHDWGADEELLLLEALEMFGMGNWGDVAEHVGSKNKTQCETHYAEVYCTRADLLPDPAKALTRDSGKGEGDASMSESGVKSEGVDSKRAGTPGLASAPGASSSKATVLSKASPPPFAPSKPKPKSGLGHLVGYIPNRGDFDTEWENDAELTLADMEFKDEDTKWERDLKLKVVEIYNSKLDARAERKKFILDRGLLERKEKKRTKEEREVYNNMRVFARFHTAEEHEAYVQGLINEARLRKRIEVLQNYRLNGIRSLADGELYEAEKRKREAQMGGKKGGYEAGGAGAGGKVGNKKRNASDALEDDRTGKAYKDGGAKGASAAAAASSASSSAGGAASAAPSHPEWDVTKMPGHELLSQQERTLCATLQLIPQHYLMIKERLIRECFTRGFLRENQAKQLIKIDVNKTAKIFDFFVSVGWLNTHDLMAANARQQQQQPQQQQGPPTGAPQSQSASSARKTPQMAPAQSSAHMNAAAMSQARNAAINAFAQQSQQPQPQAQARFS